MQSQVAVTRPHGLAVLQPENYTREGDSRVLICGIRDWLWRGQGRGPAWDRD
jgi:hypothetical protein